MKRKIIFRTICALGLLAMITLSVMPEEVHASWIPIEEAGCTVPQILPGKNLPVRVEANEPDKYDVQIEEWYISDWDPAKNEYVTEICDDFHVVKQGKTYWLRLRFIAKSGYTFTEGTRYLCNGEAHVKRWGATETENGRMKLFRPEYAINAVVPENETVDTQSYYASMDPLFHVSTNYIETMMVSSLGGAKAYKNTSDTEPATVLPYGQLLEYRGSTGSGENKIAEVVYYGSGEEVTYYVAAEDLFYNLHPLHLNINAAEYYPMYIAGFSRSSSLNVRLAPYATAPITAVPLQSSRAVMILDEWNGFSLVWYYFEDLRYWTQGSTFGWVPSASIYYGTWDEYEYIVETDPDALTQKSLYYVTKGDVVPVYNNLAEKKTAGTRQNGYIFESDAHRRYYDANGDAYLLIDGDYFIAAGDVQEFRTESYSYGRLAVAIDERARIYEKPYHGVHKTSTPGYTAGQVFTYYGVVDSFLKVWWNGKFGYVPEYATNRGHQYENETLFSEEYLNSPLLRFQTGTPVYLHPDETECAPFGYIYGGIYTYQGREGDYYKIEFRGEAGYVPVSGCLTDLSGSYRTARSLRAHEWGGAPLKDSIYDRYYCLTEDAKVYSTTDRRELTTLKAGTVVTGRADSDGGDKWIYSEEGFAGGEQYGIIGNAFLAPCLPPEEKEQVISPFEYMEGLTSRTVSFTKGERLVINANRFAKYSTNLYSFDWKLQNGAGKDITDSQLKVYRNHQDLFYAYVEKTDETLDGGIISLTINDLYGGYKKVLYYYLTMKNTATPVPALNVEPNSDGGYDFTMDTGDETAAAKHELMSEVAEQVSIGGSLFDAVISTYYVDPGTEYTFEGFTTGAFHYNDPDKKIECIDVKNLPSGGLAVTMLRINKPVGVETVSGPTASKQVNEPSALSAGSVVITVTATAKNATGAKWYAMGKDASGNVVVTEMTPGKTVNLRSFVDPYHYEVEIQGANIRTSFDPASGQAVLSFTIDNFNDWEEMPISDVFFAEFFGNGSTAVSSFTHVPTYSANAAPVTAEEGMWKQTVLPGRGIQDSQADVDLDDVNLENVHIHEFTTEVLTEDCEKEILYRMTCACGSVSEYRTTAPHEWSPWEIKTVATMLEEGRMVRRCTRCGKEETRTTPCQADEDQDGYDDESGMVINPISFFVENTETEPEATLEPETEPAEPGNNAAPVTPVWLIVLLVACGVLTFAGMIALILALIFKKKK